MPILAVKVPADLLAEIKRQARAEGRTVSGYVRYLLADVVQQRQRQRWNQRASGKTADTTEADR